MKRLAFVALLLLSACGTTGNPEVDQGIAVMNTCASVEAGIRMATALKAQGQLSSVQIARVDHVINTTRPICGGTSIPSMSQALNTLELQLLILNGAITNPGSVN